MYTPSAARGLDPIMRAHAFAPRVYARVAARGLLLALGTASVATQMYIREAIMSATVHLLGSRRQSVPQLRQEVAATCGGDVSNERRRCIKPRTALPKGHRQPRTARGYLEASKVLAHAVGNLA